MSGDAAEAPPALSTRLRMELERLLEREPWPQALDLLEDWHALPLLDPQLQNDPRRMQRLSWARRLGLPLMPALLLGAVDPVAFAQRLHIPGKHQQWLQRCYSRVVDGFTPSLGCQPVDLVDGPRATGLVAGGGGPGGDPPPSAMEAASAVVGTVAMDSGAAERRVT